MKSSVTLLSKQANTNSPTERFFTLNRKAKRGIPATLLANQAAGQARSHTLMPISAIFLFSLASHKRMLVQISSPHARRMSARRVFNTAFKRQKTKAHTQPRKSLHGWLTRAARAAVVESSSRGKH